MLRLTFTPDFLNEGQAAGNVFGRVTGLDMFLDVKGYDYHLRITLVKARFLAARNYVFCIW